MATRRIATKNRSFSRSKPASKEKRGSLLDYFRLGESYTSLILGIIVVIVAAVLLVSFAKNREGSRVSTNPVQETSSTSTTNQGNLNQLRTYTVVSGDDLWKIAVKSYAGNGYAWTEIAKANEISDPNMIEAGQKLTLPIVAKQVGESIPTSEQPTPTQSVMLTATPAPVGTAPTQATDRITGNSYNVVRGDFLWEIAIRAYGDGYQWTKIAQANNLVQPNIIHSGNVLKIPR